MELDETQVLCLKNAAAVAVFERVQCTTENITLRDSSTQSIRGTTQLVSPVEKASPEQRPLHTVCSINSAIASYKSHHSWPRQVSVLLLDWGQTI